jgi:hypothetical protein
MKKAMFILSILITTLLIFGCTSTDQNINTENNTNNTWSQKVSELGEPTYQKVTIQGGYEILPFPGLTYSGLRDNYQAFYATNSDNTFAIYAVPAIITTEASLDEVKETIKSFYAPYTPSITCEDISTSGWITSAKAFKCNFYYTSINADYKTVIFYNDGKYVQTILGVWGTDLGTYEYIFDEFNQKAVSWK